MSKEEILAKHEIGSGSLYFNRVMAALDEWGRIKWKEAQQSALKANSKKLDKDNRHPIASFTPYKP